MSDCCSGNADEFFSNLVVPTDQPTVPEYTWCEGDTTEKTQDLLYKRDAIEAGRLLMIKQLERRALEIRRALEDLGRPGDLCEE